MVVSTGFGAVGAIDESAAVTPPELRGARLIEKAIPDNVNETGTLVSEWVHLCEIVVIPGIDRLPGHHGISADRLPFADGADISAAIPPQRSARTKSWRLNAPFRLSSLTRPRAI
jgi:hypothetical protein